MKEINKVTVIMPVYNAERYLEEALESVVNQSLNGIEIIIVDDGSKDKSLQIIEKYKNLYGNIKVIKQANKGVSVARNVALKNTSGKYLYYMDADDLLEEKALEKLYIKAEENQCDLIIFGHKELDERGNIVNVKLDYNETDIYSGEGVSEEVLKGKFLGTLWNKFFLKEKFISERIEFENNRYVQDWFPVFKYINTSKKIMYMNNALYTYRINRYSITSKNTMKNVIDYEYAGNSILEYGYKSNMNKEELENFRLNTVSNLIRKYYSVKKDRKISIYDDFDNEEFAIAKKISIFKVVKNRQCSLKNRVRLVLWRCRLYHIILRGK